MAAAEQGLEVRRAAFNTVLLGISLWPLWTFYGHGSKWFHFSSMWGIFDIIKYTNTYAHIILSHNNYQNFSVVDN